MYLVICASAILDKGVDVWDEFCKDYGLDPWCINEGRVRSDEEFRISYEDALKYRLIRED